MGMIVLSFKLPCLDLLRRGIILVEPNQEAEHGEEIQDGEAWWPDAQEEGDEVEEEKETGAETRSARSAAGANGRLSLL